MCAIVLGTMIGKVIWIVEVGAFRTGSDAFEDAVRRKGGELRWLSVDDEFRGRYGRWEEGDVVVFRGSFEAAESFRSKRPDAIPGVIGEAKTLRCSSYYPALDHLLLNVEHEFLPLNELRSRWVDLRARHGDALFLRPDSGAKAFTGQVVADLERFEARERLYLEAMDPNELVVVAPLRRIEQEWRTVVVDGKVVAESRYKSGGTRDVAPLAPAEVLSFAQTIASNIEPPALAYMLDVAREEGGRLSVVELNSFSCSDVYSCDPLPVVGAVQDMLSG